jgi:hypothetical protein
MLATLLKRLVAAALAGALLLWPGAPAARADEVEQRVTITARAKPLGAVLDELGRETGLRFMLDPAWRAHPVTVDLVDVALPLALKRILDGLNSAVVYRPDASVRVVILDNLPAASPPAGGPAAPPPSRSLRQPVDRGPAPPPRVSAPALPPPPLEPPAPGPSETQMHEGDE